MTARSSATRTFRFRMFDVVQEPGATPKSGVTTDESALPEYEAVCVIGEDADCGAHSGSLGDSDELARWMAEHTRDTGHQRYRRAYCEYALVEPGAWL